MSFKETLSNICKNGRTCVELSLPKLLSWTCPWWPLQCILICFCHCNLMFLATYYVQTQWKEPNGIKLKVISKDCIWHVGFMCWYYIPFFHFWYQVYNYVLDINNFLLHLDHISCILASMIIAIWKWII
jgi:hypothetical protein